MHTDLIHFMTKERLNILAVLSGHGVPWTVHLDAAKEGEAPSYRINIAGFYKSGSVDLRAGEGDVRFIAHARYGETEAIRFVGDLVDLNYRWWRRSEDRDVSWRQPDPLWVSLLLANGHIVAREVPATTVYDPT